MKIIVKLLSIVLMIASPVISGKAFYEYVAVKYFNHKPTYPFGKVFMNTIHSNHIQYLRGYEQQLLTIAIVFLFITILLYISTFIKALFNLIWLAFALFAAFFIYRMLG